MRKTTQWALIRSVSKNCRNAISTSCSLARAFLLGNRVSEESATAERLDHGSRVRFSPQLDEADDKRGEDPQRGS